MIKFIDLFAGMGGTRIGFENACKEFDIQTQCVFTSEIKPYAVDLYKHNFNNETVHGDITQIRENDIPDFDFLLGGFPCQAFSTAGKLHGFNDTRGTLFFDIVRILKAKNPSGFLLENVAGLLTHDKQNKNDKIGKTFDIILSTLESLGYKVSWKILDAQDFGVPQKRERIYIVGSKVKAPNLSDFISKKSVLKDILQQGLPCKKTAFTSKLLELFPQKRLYGKAIKDKRGGLNNIHSWDLELKGAISKEQKELMGILLKERRKKHWAEKKGIDWMDGMPLTLHEIHSFYNHISVENLNEMLIDLTKKKYLSYEHPKALYTDEKGMKYRKQDISKEKGFNIVAGKLSFEINNILDPNNISNTIVATEVDRIGVLDNDGIRNLSDRECLRLSGFPDTYNINISTKNLYDLIGNTVVVPVIQQVAKRLIQSHQGIEYISDYNEKNSYINRDLFNVFYENNLVA